MQLLTKVNFAIDRFLRFFITLSLGLMLALIFIQVIFRYVFHNSLTFSEELSRYLFVWTVFLGIPVVLRMGGHMAVGVITERISGKWLKILRIIANLLFLIFMFVIFQNGLLMSQKMVFQKSPAMQISMSYVYYAIPIGAMASVLITFEDLIKIFLTPASETKPELSAE